MMNASTLAATIALCAVLCAPLSACAADAGSEAEAAAAQKLDPPARQERDRADRGVVVRTYDEAASALNAAGARVTLDLCNAGGCGVRSVRVGEIVTVRVTSPAAGRLWLLDRNAEGVQQQIFPNGLSRPGETIAVEAGQSVELPRPEHRFVFQISEPVGASTLTAMVIAEEFEAPQAMQRNARNTRGIGVVSREEMDAVAAPVTAAIAANAARPGAAIGELAYTVTR